jgi:hypothetical protein
MLKPDAKTVQIKEQLIGNRDFQFDADGILVGTGTGLSNSCNPKA